MASSSSNLQSSSDFWESKKYPLFITFVSLIKLKLNKDFDVIILLVLIVQFIIIALIIGIVGFICFVFCSYYVFNFFKINTNNSFFFKDYNEDIKHILVKYGDCKIKNIYILRQRLPAFVFKIINIISFYKYSEMFMPHHTSLIFEIKTNKLNNVPLKFLKVEKNNYININENYNINRTQDIKYIRYKSKNGKNKKSKCNKLNQILNMVMSNSEQKKNYMILFWEKKKKHIIYGTCFSFNLLH